MTPKDQLIKEIEGQKDKIDKELTKMRLIQAPLSKGDRDYIERLMGRGEAFGEAISTIKSFLKDYELVKKGDLLTDDDIIWMAKFGLPFSSNPEVERKLKALGGGEG